jgi:hypothetical protein
MKLYELAAAYRNLWQKLENEEEIPENYLELLNEIEGSLTDKLIGCACVIRNLCAERDAVKDAMKGMKKRVDALDNKIDNLDTYMCDNMQRANIGSVNTSPLFVIKLRKNPASVYPEKIDIAGVPEEYIRLKETREIDKLKLKADLIAGKKFDFAELRSKLRVEII